MIAALSRRPRTPNRADPPPDVRGRFRGDLTRKPLTSFGRPALRVVASPPWWRRSPDVQAKRARPRSGGRRRKDPMNSVNLIGRLTRDPEKRATPGGTDVCTMRVAIQRAGSNGSDFVNVTAFGKLAESCS